MASMIPIPPPLTLGRATPITDAALLTEPDRMAGGPWCASVARRLVAAYARPVAHGADIRYAPRFEAAGWPVLGPDADPERARGAFWPLAESLYRLGIGYGSLSPALVVIGERVGLPDQLPFHARSGTWLFCALRDLGYDELTVYATNARSYEGESLAPQLEALRAILAPAEPRYLAVGAIATQACRRLGLPAVEAQHPAKHKRFSYRAGPHGYAKLLLEAGLPAGPWAPNPVLGLGGSAPALPVVPGDLPDLPEPYHLRSPAFVKGETAAGRRGRPSLVHPRKRERARLLYVEGKVSSLVKAAAEVGASYRALSQVARDEDWASQRAANLRRVTEEALSLSREREAAVIARGLGAAFQAVEIGIARHMKHITDDPEAVSRPGEIKAMLDVAVGLKNLAEGKGPEGGAPVLRGESLIEALERLKAAFVGEKKDVKP